MIKLPTKLRYVLTLAVVATLISAVFSLISYLAVIGERENISFTQVFFPTLIRFGFWAVFFPFIYKLTQKYDFQSVNNYLRNIGIHILLVIFFSSIQFLSFTAFSWLVGPNFLEKYTSFWQYLQSAFLGSFYLGLLIYGLILFGSQAYLRNKNFAEQERKNSELQSQLIKAQLQALKMQLQPHFLFNTLNSISSLVNKNPVQAQTMIAKLGDFLRMTLEFNKNQMVLLSEELNFLRSYLDIEQTRFSEKLKVIFNVDENAENALVPHLLLQPIVENSVKHGISQMTEGGVIEIIVKTAADKLILTVKDNGRGQIQSNVSDGNKQTGLANIKARLRHLYKEGFSFEMKNQNETETVVAIIIPLSFDFVSLDKNDE